jgi:CRP/FNR family transcriptional regulator, cyclic AMP receptor protein
VIEITSVMEFSGYLAAFLVFMTFYMKTMVPLRLVGICSNCAFIAYGYLGGLYPVLVLHAILLPLNALRLHQMRQLAKQVREAAQGDRNLDWIKPFTSSRHVQVGEILFNKGDVVTAMFVVVSGRYRLVESGIELAPPQVVGELAFFAPQRSRTQTLQCVEAGTLLQISYDQVEQLYFQNPRFGFYFIGLITQRLFQNIARLESELASCRKTLAAHGLDTPRS